MLNKKEYLILELIRCFGDAEPLESYSVLADKIISLGDKYQEKIEAEEDAGQPFDFIGDDEL